MTCYWPSQPPRRNARLTAAILISTLALPIACRHVEEPTKQIVRGVDPTGALDEIKSRERAARTLEQKIAELSIDDFNRALIELEALAISLRDKVDALPSDKINESVERIASITQLLENDISATRIDQTFEAINLLAETADTRLQQLDTEAASLSLYDLSEAIAELRRLIEQIGDALIPTLDQTRATASQAEQSLKSLPVTELTAAIQDVSTRIGSLEESTRTIITGLQPIPAQVQSSTNAITAAGWSIAATGVVAILALLLWITRQRFRRT